MSFRDHNTLSFNAVSFSSLNRGRHCWNA